MYGKMLNSRAPVIYWYEKPVFIESYNDFGEVDSSLFDQVQAAYSCCGDQLPHRGEEGQLWLCHICERVWGIPEGDALSWSLTRMKYVDEAEKHKFAFDAYRWRVISFVVMSLTFLATIIGFIVVLKSDASRAVVSSMMIFGFGVLVSAVSIFIWRKMIDGYNIRVSD